MKIRTAVPWISLLLTVVTVLNPVGMDFLRSAFFSNEQLSRNIAQPIVLSVLAILAMLALVEWLIRHTLIRRARSRGQA